MSLEEALQAIVEGLRTVLGLSEVIKHEGDKWVLYSADGKKKLGTFDSEAAAKKREREIQFFKHKESGTKALQEPDRKHHSAKWHSCFDQLQGEYGSDSAAAICTWSLSKTGAVYEAQRLQEQQFTLTKEEADALARVAAWMEQEGLESFTVDDETFEVTTVSKKPPAPVEEAIVVNGVEMSHDQVRTLLVQAVDAERAPVAQADGTMVQPRYMTWIRDVYDTWFVYSDDATGKYYQRTYVIDAEGTVTMGAATEVIAQTVYVPVGEAAMLESDCIPLVEKAVRKDGSIPLKVIQPGWGTSGYYSPEVLKRDGPKVFKAGLHCYWDHPTQTEESERPERSLRDLAATLTADAAYKDNGSAGPGLYADAQMVKPYRDAIEELAPHIGMSIRAKGRAKTGEVDGRKGPVIEEIVAAQSVDFVTVPGAGGQILQLFESARQKPAPKTEEGKTVDEKEAQALREANVALTAEVARLREGQLLREARDFVTAALAAIDMPDLTRTRLVEVLAAKPIVKDGKLDEAAYKTAIEAAAKLELEYLAKATGSGKITGMGNVTPEPGAGLKESYTAYYRQQGKPQAEAEKLAAEAAQRR